MNKKIILSIVAVISSINCLKAAKVTVVNLTGQDKVKIYITEFATISGRKTYKAKDMPPKFVNNKKKVTFSLTKGTSRFVVQWCIKGKCYQTSDLSEHKWYRPTFFWLYPGKYTEKTGVFGKPVTDLIPSPQIQGGQPNIPAHFYQ